MFDAAANYIIVEDTGDKLHDVMHSVPCFCSVITTPAEAVSTGQMLYLLIVKHITHLCHDTSQS